MGTPLNGSIVKGFEILSLFSDGLQEVSMATVADSLHMNSATAHRLLMTLENVGALRTTRRGVFALGPEIDRLGKLAEESNSIALLIQPHLEKLSRRLNESVMASYLSRHGPTCLAVANSRQAISVNIEVGTLLPLHSTAQGKLWLAEMSEQERASRLSALSITDKTIPELSDLDQELSRIKRLGYSTNLGNNEPDIAAVSVPIKNSDNEMKLSISVFGMLSRFTNDNVDQIRNELSKTALQISPVL